MFHTKQILKVNNISSSSILGHSTNLVKRRSITSTRNIVAPQISILLKVSLIEDTEF